VTAGKAGLRARLDNFVIEVKVPLALSEADRPAWTRRSTIV